MVFGFIPFLGASSDGKAQVTREPTGQSEADGAWGPPRPPRPRPSRAGTGPLPRSGTGPLPRAGTGPLPRAGTGPLPRAATGPIQRVPAADPLAHGDDDPWRGTAPGFEF